LHVLSEISAQRPGPRIAEILAILARRRGVRRLAQRTGLSDSQAVNPPFVIPDALVSLQNLSLRLPLELHKQMKKRAKEVGITASAHYSDVMADFLDNHVEHFPYLFTGPGSSAVTLSVEPALVARLRDVADAKDRATVHERGHPANTHQRTSRPDSKGAYR
jgi:hypothetical protein